MNIIIDKINYSVNNKTILNNISFTINKNEILAILGPNGSGKTSLVNILSGDVIANSGKIFFNNTLLKNIDIKERAKIRSVMSQSSEIVYNYTVLEIIEMGWIRDYNVLIKPSFDEVLSNISNECEIRNLLNRKFNTLSGGEQRRVHFARTLIQLYSYPNIEATKYILLDEPTANLDLPHKLSMLRILQNKSKEGFAVVLVLHDLNLAYSFSDKILLLKQGEIAQYGSPIDVFTEKNLSNVYNIPIMVDKKNKTIKYY